MDGSEAGADGAAPVVRDDPGRSRYEVVVDGVVAGFSAYRLHPGVIAFTHTEVDPAFGGRGLASALVAAELEDARRRGLAVQPFCPFVRRVVASHPEAYLDLVRAQDRERFDLPAA